MLNILSNQNKKIRFKCTGCGHQSTKIIPQQLLEELPGRLFIGEQVGKIQYHLAVEKVIVTCENIICGKEFVLLDGGKQFQEVIKERKTQVKQKESDLFTGYCEKLDTIN